MITSFKEFIELESNKDYYKKLKEFVVSEYENYTCFPPYKNIFHSLTITPLNEVKVVILGQDPYHGAGQAEGLSFSVKKGIPKPPSLQNIFKELKADIGCDIPIDGSLLEWANKGVLLLNAVLTVEENKPASHKYLGWETFTDEVIKKLNNKNTPVVFILWGAFARNKKKYITNPMHFIVESAHPSPFSAYNGFFGSKPFSKTNEFLIKNGITPIEWNLK